MIERPPLPAGSALRALEDRPGAGEVAVRPDGYVGFRSSVVDGRLHGWLVRAGVAAIDARQDR